ncbi:MAG: endonuclease [Bacteroidota bacterium]
MRFLLLALSFCVSTLATAQVPVNLNSSNITFPGTFEDQPDSIFLRLTNTGMEPSEVEAAVILGTYPIFDQPAFSVSPAQLVLPANGVDSFSIKFSPRHNIQHVSTLVLTTGAGEIAVELEGQGKYRNTYYVSTENTSEEALKSALRTRLAQGYRQLSYNAARDRMFLEIDNQRLNGQGASVNTLECVYTGRQITGYTSRSAAQSQGNFNTEHTYPRSFFNSNLPMQSDIHHLFPTDQTANSRRANFPFGTVSGSASWQVGGSKLGTNNVFEPRDQHKGLVARAMIYYLLRYGNDGGFFTSQEAILRQWHEDFPPTSIDQNRNDGIFREQNNRNPLVDYPQFLERIQSLSSSSSQPMTSKLVLAQDTVTVEQFPAQGQYYPVIIANEGTVPLEVGAVIASLPAIRINNLPSFPLTIDPGTFFELQLTFDTSADSLFPAALTISSDATEGLQEQVLPFVAGTNLNVSLEDRFPAWGKPSFFPNPASEFLSLKWEAGLTGNIDIRLMTLQGEVLWEGRLHEGSTGMEIPISPAWANQTLLLTLDYQGVIWQEKVILHR